jgi:hypothetical protein
VVSVDDFLHDVEGESTQFGRGPRAGDGPGDGDVEVEVAEGCVAEPGGVFFNPLRGADEGVFFGVPGGEDAVLL